jgi:hypothetical protein
VKRLVTVVTLVVLLVGVIIIGLSGKDVCVADTSVLNSEIATNQTQARNSSASATITITMYTGDE